MDSLLMSTAIIIDAERFPASNAVNDSFYKPTVDQRITFLDGFISQHRHGTDTQISVSADVLLNNLAAGELISESIMRAEAAFHCISASEQFPPMTRHFDAVVDLDTARRAA